MKLLELEGLSKESLALYIDKVRTFIVGSFDPERDFSHEAVDRILFRMKEDILKVKEG